MLDMGCRFSKLNLSDRPMLCWGMLGVHTQSWLYLLFSCWSPVPPCHKVLPMMDHDGPLEPRDVRYHCSTHMSFNSPCFQDFPGSSHIVNPQHQGDEDAAVRMEADKAEWVAGMGQPKTGFCFQHGALVHPQNWSF